MIPAARTLDVSGLPSYTISNKAPLFWGQVLLCVIEGTMFCMVIAIYFYLRLRVDVWPPPGMQIPDLGVATFGWIPLLLSCVGSYWASEAAKKDRVGGMIGGLSVNLILAIVFLGFRYISWRAMNFNWAADAHGTVVWTILFLHTLDVFADLLFTLVLIVILAIGRHGPKQRIGVHVDGVVWYFLVAIWLPLYAVVYWGPYLVGNRG